VVVAVPGGPAAPGIRHGLGDFASLLAGQGAVVFVADYREGAQYGGTFPLPYEDIGCAIRYARANAAQYGGDGSRVTLVAHSLGGFFASTEALSPDPFTPAPGACLTTSGSTKPDAFIGIAAIYSQQEITPGFLDALFGTTGGGTVGGTGSAGGAGGAPASGAPGGFVTGPGGLVPGASPGPGSAPAAWAAGNPFALVQAHGNPGLVVRLIQGADDTNVRPAEAQSFEQALQAAGYNAALTMVPNADHNSVLQNALTIRTVMETALGLGR
jgi:acetyl esterase/lipase